MNADALENMSYEELAHALYMKGKNEGFRKITDKTQWREAVVADKLGHVCHTAISSGADSLEYGSDAFDPTNNVYAEYKSSSISDDDENSVRKLLGMKNKRGKDFKVGARVGGVYNGAYKDSAIEAYSKIEHYFSVFFEEVCVLIAKVDTTEVIRQLTHNNDNRKPGKSTNLNTVSVDLDSPFCEIVYDNRSFFNEKNIVKSL